jgi:putative ABC transport system permease protein
LTGPRYQDPAAQQRFYETLIERAATLPGVRSAAAIDEVPSGGSGGAAITFEEEQRPLVESLRPRAALRIVGGDYFATMGIRMQDGRTFNFADDGDSPRVAVVSSGLALSLGGERAVVGRRLRLGGLGDVPWEVIGVVSDVQVGALDAETPPVVYLSHLQRAENRLVLVLRTESPATALASQLRDVVQAMDGGVPVYAVSTIEGQMRDSRALFSRRFPLVLCAVFAIAALALTLVALYAVFLHEVLTRHREFGIRLALGGSPGSVRALVLRDAAILGVVGIVVGVVVAGVVSRSMEAVLYGVASADWRIYGLVAAGVLLASLMASLWPAFRAGSVRPSIVMRSE